MPHTGQQPKSAQRPPTEVILDSLDEGVLTVSPDGVIGYANRRAETIFGYGAGELFGLSLEALVPERTREDHQRYRAGFGINPQVRLMCRRPSIRARRKDGTEFPVAVVLQPLADGGVLTLVRDEAAVHAHPREAEAALSRAVVDVLEERIAVVNGAGEIIATSAAWDAFARSARCPAQQCGVGANYLEVCRRATGPGAEGAAEMARGLSGVLSGAAERFAIEYPCPTGGPTRWYRALVKPLTGEPTGAVVVHLEVTEQRHAERVLAESERRLRDVVEAQTELICRFLPDGTLTFVNGAYCRYVNRSERELLGHRLWELMPEADREPVARHLASLTPERPSAAVEHRVLRADGATRWQEWTNRAFFDDSGRVIDFQSVGRDITDRKCAEIALRDSAERHRLILSALHEGVLLLDERGGILTLNERAARLFGAPERLAGARPEEMLGDVRGPDANSIPSEQLPWEVTRHTQAACVGTVLVATRGEHPPVRLTVNTHALPGPGPTFSVVVSLTDVTAQWRVEEQLKQHQNELAHVSRCVTIGEMAAVLAHELNQPLATVVNYCRGSTHRLRAGTGTAAEVADGLDLAVAQAERAADIIRRLREFMRKREPHRSTTDLNDIVNETLSLVGPELRQHQIDVSLHFGKSLPPVRVDRIQIEQVLLNLLRNAAEALAEVPAPGRRITIDTRWVEGGVLVEVADTGVGLAAGDVGRVFEPFYTTKKQGLGLGLAISRSIIEAHDGRLFVRPGAEGGAVFGFTLPTESAPGGPGAG